MPFKSRRFPVSTDRRFRRTEEITDHGTRERWQHSGSAFVSTEQAGVLAVRATEEHILDILVLRGLIGKIESEAGFKFKLDYQRAALGLRLIGCYNPAKAMGELFYSAHERGDFEEAAYQRWRNAVRELGQIFSGLLISVVCHDRCPSAGDIPYLSRGLKKLADWYGMPEEEKASAPPARNSDENIEQAAAR